MFVLSYATSTEVPLGPVVQFWLELSGTLLRLSLVSILAHMSRAVYRCSQLEPSDPEMGTLVRVKGGMSDQESGEVGAVGMRKSGLVGRVLALFTYEFVSFIVPGYTVVHICVNHTAPHQYACFIG